MVMTIIVDVFGADTTQSNSDRYHCSTLPQNSMMKSFALLLLCLSHGLAFTLPVTYRKYNVKLASKELYSDDNSFDPSPFSEENSMDVEVLIPRKRGIRGFFYNRFAGFVSGLVGFVTQGIAADDYEIAELPPP
jgi:hypothetical protein